MVDWPSMPNNHQVLWIPWDSLGIEHLRFDTDVEGNVTADGLVIGLADGVPFRVRYVIRLDKTWNVSSVHINQLDLEKVPTFFSSNKESDWFDSLRKPVPSVSGCTDIDLSVSPFTNTIPIRRLNLEVGESAEIDVAYFKLPGFQVNPVRQRYTLLESTPTGHTYRYESIDSGYTADLPVDEYGLIVDYPEAWRRVKVPSTS
jgi:hypothetical protein